MHCHGGTNPRELDYARDLSFATNQPPLHNDEARKWSNGPTPKW